MMSWVCCSLTYLFVSFLIYTSLDHRVVESSPIISDSPLGNVDPNTGLALDTDTVKKYPSSEGNNDNANTDANNNNRDEHNLNIHQENAERNNVIDEREEKYAEGLEHDAAHKAEDDGVLNEDVKEGVVPGRENIGGNEQEAESQIAQEDEVDGNGEQSVQENYQSVRMSDNSAQKEELLPADVQEGHAVKPVRSPGMAVDEGHYQQNSNAVQDPQNLNAMQDPQNLNAVQNQQNLNAVQNQQNLNAVQNQQDLNAVQNQQNLNAVQDPQYGSAVQNQQNVNAEQNNQQNIQNPDTENRYPIQEQKPNQYDIIETLRKLGIMVNRPVQGYNEATSTPTQNVPKADQTVRNQPPVQTNRNDQDQSIPPSNSQRIPANNIQTVPKETYGNKDDIHQDLSVKPQTTQALRNVEIGVTQSQRLSEANLNSGGQIGLPVGSLSRPSYIQGSQPPRQDHNPVPYSRDSQNVALSNDQQQSLSSQKDVDVPAEFNADAASDEEPDNHYSDDGYLDPPANNLDSDRTAQDKTDEDVNRNNNNYDDSSDPNANNLNNKNIIDDNNEQVLYNGQDNAYNEDTKKDDDESYEDTLYDDKDDYSYEEKIDRIDGDESKSTTLTPSDKDAWYSDDSDDIVEGKESDVNDTDFVDTVIDEEVDFQRTHVKHPQSDDDNSLYFSNGDPKIQEGIVEYKLVKNRNSLNAPSSMVLFYTWIILIVLIAVVTLSAFRYRCKGIMNGQRNHRNGNHCNYRNGEESKKLLENVYT